MWLGQAQALRCTVVQGLQQELAALREWQRSLPLRPSANIAAPAAGDRRELHHCLGAWRKCAVAERNRFKDRCVISPCAGGTVRLEIAKAGAGQGVRLCPSLEV